MKEEKKTKQQQQSREKYEFRFLSQPFWDHGHNLTPSVCLSKWTGLEEKSNHWPLRFLPLGTRQNNTSHSAGKDGSLSDGTGQSRSGSVIQTAAELRKRWCSPRDGKLSKPGRLLWIVQWLAPGISARNILRHLGITQSTLLNQPQIPSCGRWGD